jgi:hypothetical protein
MLNLERTAKPLVAARRRRIGDARIQKSYMTKNLGVEEAEKNGRVGEVAAAAVRHAEITRCG